jgi:hypothetical protein
VGNRFFAPFGRTGLDCGYVPTPAEAGYHRRDQSEDIVTVIAIQS